MSTSIVKALEEADRIFGKQLPTYDPTTRNDILNGVIPEWLARGRIVLKGEARERCQKTIDGLRRMHAELRPSIDMASMLRGRESA